MKITGEMLKSERLNQKLSLQDVASSLKLSLKIITHIESGNIDSLPAKTFVRGFVKSYAQFLKLDADAVLRQFQEEMGSTNPLPKTPPPLPSANENNFKTAKPSLMQSAKKLSSKNPAERTNYLNSENPKKIILMISIATLLIVALVISNKLVDNFRANSINPETSANISAERAATITAPVQKITSSSGDQSLIPITAKISADKTAAELPKPVTGLEEGFEKSPGKPVEVLIEAKKDLEILYAKGDSFNFIPLKISANRIQIIRSKIGLYLKTTDGSALKISVNGVEVKPLGAGNKTLKLTF